MIPARRPFDSVTHDLVGPFYPPSSIGNLYLLTCNCLLTSYPIVIPMPDKHTETVTQGYLQHENATFGGSLTMVQSKEKEMTHLKKWQKNEAKTFSSSYHPQSDGILEKFCSFLKACIRKHIHSNLDLEDSNLHSLASGYPHHPL